MKLNPNYLIVSLILFSIFTIPLIDTDFGWHYRCGQQIVEQGRLCSTNDFTLLLNGYHWNSPAHGYQILLYFLYNLGGFPLIAVFYGLSAAAVFLIFLNSLKGNLYLKLMAFLPLVWFGWITLGLGFRSQILSVYFLAIYLTLVELSQRKPKAIFLTIPLMFVWSNSHPGFFLGVILSFFLLAEQIELIVLKKFDSKNFLRTISAVAGNLLITLVNPLGWGIYQEAWRHAQVPLNTLIVEWLPPFAWQRYFIFISSLISLLLILRFGQRKVLRLLVLGLTAYLAFEARRSLALFTIGLTFSFFDSEIAEKLERVFRAIASRELLIFIFLPILLYNLNLNGPRLRTFNEQEYCQKALVVMPCGAVEFLKTQKKTNVFNAYEWGGFLEWQLPNFKFFIDGRMPSWDTSQETRLPPSWRGKSPWTVYLEMTQTQPGWDEILKSYQMEYLLISPGNALDILLRPDPAKYGYRIFFLDGISIIYQRI